MDYCDVFYQLFGLLCRRHPITAEDLQRNLSKSVTMKNVSGYACNHGSLRIGNEILRPLEGAMGTPSAWPVSEAWMKKQQCIWHWQVEAYDVGKWVTAGIKEHLWNTSSSFFSKGDADRNAQSMAASRSLFSGNHGYMLNLRHYLSKGTTCCIL